jgi:hypothetical protein
MAGWDGVSLTFCVGWPQTTILPICAFQIPGITDESHCTQPRTSLILLFILSFLQFTYMHSVSLCQINLVILLCLKLFFGGTGVWTQGLHFESFHQPFFCEGFFQDWVSRTVCPDWLRTAILLVSASWVARVTGVSYWHLALKHF